MRRCHLLLPLWLAACGAVGEAPLSAPPLAPGPLADAALFDACDGWTGRAPVTERELALAAEAELACAARMRGQLAALARIYGVAP